MKALVMYSSFSGRKGIEKKIEYITKRLEEKYIVTIFKSTHVGSMREYVETHGEEFDLVVATGGDGTVHDAVNGVMSLKKRPALAYIPTGTINDQAKSLGIRKRRLKKSVDIILSGRRAYVDVFKINEKYFAYGLAAGCLTEISYDAPHKLKQNIGRVAYYLEAIKAIRKTKPIELELLVNGEKIKSSFSLFLALNTRYLAGFKIHRRKRIYLDDGEIRLTLIKRNQKLLDLFDFAMFLLLGEAYKHNVRHISASSFTVTSKEMVAYNTDGENFGRVNKLDVSLVPQAFQICLSKRVLRRHFLHKETGNNQ